MATKRTNTGNKLCTKRVRWAIYERDGLRCIYCRRPYDLRVKFSLDHVVAHANGGTDDPTNLVACCQKCNSSKKDRTLEDWFRLLEYKGRISRRQIAGIRRRLATYPLRPLD